MDRLNCGDDVYTVEGAVGNRPSWRKCIYMVGKSQQQLHGT